MYKSFLVFLCIIGGYGICHTHAATHNRDKEARRRKDSREEDGVEGVSKLPI